MAEATNPTPEREAPDGTATPEATLQAGTDETSITETNPESTQPSVDYEDKFKASAEEGKRLHTENQHLKTQMTLIQQQQQQQQQAAYQQQQQQQVVQQQQQTPDMGIVTKADAKKLNEAFLQGDDGVIQDTFNQVLGKYNHNQQQQQYQQAVDQQQLQTAYQLLSQVAPELNDPNSAVAQKTLQKYAEIASNSWRMSTYKPANVDYGGISYNLNALREAALEAKAELGSAEDKAASTVTEFVEPSQRSNTPTAEQATKQFNPSVHLFPYEREAADKTKARGIEGYQDNPYKKYWESLEKAHPGMHQSRLDAGKPLRAPKYGVI